MTIPMQPIPAGKYIVAVSGGVDSMALLDLLRQYKQLELVVAHVNHGVRSDSIFDEELVVSFCKSHNINYVVKKLHLGKEVSEAVARTARYAYMRHCRVKYQAQAIITAHHQDDLIETALINLRRGTGWRGMALFTSNTDIFRPLVNVTKNELRHYATTHAVPWREDSTNTDQRYLRNYVRHTLMPLMTKRSPDWREYFLQLIRNQQVKRRKIEDDLARILPVYATFDGDTAAMKRYDWIMLSSSEAYELFQNVCRQHLGHSIVADLARQALLFIRTAKPHKAMPLSSQWQLRATHSQIILEPRSSVVS